MNNKIKENINQFNQVKVELAKQDIEIGDYCMKTKKLRLVKNGEYVGKFDLKNNTLELR